jgi:hypothetical protein
MSERSCPRRVVLFLGLAAALIAGEARAADTGNGSKNFSTPQSVPNYFSNEAGPLQGAASETQRGPLYMGQTYGQLQQPGARPVVAQAPAYRQQVAFAAPRGRLIRERGGRVVAHHIIVHGRTVTRVVARGTAHGHTASAVHRASYSTHTTSHTTTRASSSHRHARG